MRILVIRLSAIGDIVLTAATLRCLRQRFGEALELHFLVKKQFKSAAALLSEVDVLHEYDAQRRGECLRTLQSIAFDAVVDLQNSWRTLLLRWRLRARRVLVVDKLNVRKWLYVRFKMQVMPDRHVALRYIDAVRLLGVKYDGLGLTQVLRSDAVATLPADIGERVAIAIGAAHATKRIPTDTIAAVIALLAAAGRGVVLLGAGAVDDERAAEILRLSSGAAIAPISLVGRLTLAQSVYVLQSAAATLAGDTGLMHIAAALARPLCLVWGSTTPQLGMSAFYPDGQAARLLASIDAPLPCRPCSKLGKTQCPKGHFHCMRLHAPANIADTLLRLIDKNTQNPS